MELDRLKHRIQHQFQANAKPEHSHPDVGLILLHLFKKKVFILLIGVAHS